MAVGQVLTIPETGWKRYDEVDPRILCNGWDVGATASAYGGGLKSSSNNSLKLNFNFKGSKLRIVGATNTTGSTSVKITIDGVSETFSCYNGSLVWQCLNYEKVGLSDTFHSVEIQNLTTTGQTFWIDAIDIDSTGDLLGTGIQLTTPDSGWRRYDEADSRVLYSGFNYTSYASDYNGGYRLSNTLGSKATFKFYGTKLRIITPKDSSFSSNITIRVDGALETFSEYTSGGTVFIYVTYEKVGLALGVHTVEITANDNLNVGLDAIDIDTSGYLVHPILNQVSDIYSMNIGDCIPVQYTALTSGSVGFFSELGSCIANEIPITSSATPNGLLYLVKVAEGLLVADRVVQHSISWDTLNGGKMIEGYIKNCIPTMTSNTAPSGICSAGSVYDGTYAAWRAFDKGTFSGGQSYWNAASQSSWIAYEFPLPKIITGYAFKSIDDYGNRCPKNITFEGWDGTQWVVLDTRVAPQNVILQKFYFANKIAYKKYRLNIASTYSDVISLDTVEMYEDILIRSLSGGSAYANANGTISTTDKGYGAFPVNNEWDKYITKSDLGNKITPGSNLIWNLTTIYTWCKDTSILALAESSRRSNRGVTTGWAYSNTVSPICGFRPVFEFLETDTKSTNLYY